MHVTNMILIPGVSSIGYQGHICINFVQVTIVLLSDVWSTK